MSYRQAIPNHCHRRMKEDIICRVGVISVQLFLGQPGKWDEEGVIQILNVKRPHRSGDVVHLRAGERVTIPPPVYHEFWALSNEAIVGEVSTKNDDLHDNLLVNPRVGRFPKVEEDEPPLVWRVGERTVG